MIKACNIDKEYWNLKIGDTFVWKTKKRIDECIVVGIKYIDNVRTPLAIRLLPNHRFTKVYEIHDI